MPAHEPHCIEVIPPDRPVGKPVAGRPALFLDRDGVINHRRYGLVRHWGHFRFKPTALDAFRLAAEHDVPVFIATNQPWVETGYIRLEDLEDTHRRMITRVQKAGGRIDAAFACVHADLLGCDCRKPRPAMLHAAAKRYGVDLSRSWMVGDNAKDMHAGRTAGAHTVLVDPRLRTWLQGARKHADAVVQNVFEATLVALEGMDLLRDRPTA